MSFVVRALGPALVALGLAAAMALTSSSAQAQIAPNSPTVTTTPTATATATPTFTASPTVTSTPTQTPSPTTTVAPTATTVPTATPSGGISVRVAPLALRIRPGDTIALDVDVTFNPTNATVPFTAQAGDGLSAALLANSAWSPEARIAGTGRTQLILGTSRTLAPGVYTIKITGTGPSGANVQTVRVEVLPAGALFESEVLRRNEYQVLGPEMLPPYRGGDAFYYQPRVNALLQWRPEQNTYFHANTSELIEQSGNGAAQYRLPPVVLDDGSGGAWDAAVRARVGWMTDPAIGARFLQPPPKHSGPWDVNGSITLYGLPVSKPTQIGPYVVQRFQRAVFRHWIGDSPSHPEWQDSVAVIPLQESVLTYLPEIDPLAAGQIARSARGGEPSPFPGWWEIDSSAASGFAAGVLESSDENVARVRIANPTGIWLEVSLIGPVGTRAEVVPGQSVITDWPGLPPLSWILEPGQSMLIVIPRNQAHPSAEVRSASVVHLWSRPSARAAMAHVAQSMASVGMPELGELHGSRLSAYYRALLGAASRSGQGPVGCLVALDGDVNAGDDPQFARDLACAAAEPMTGYVMAQAAAAIGVGVDPTVVSGRLDLGALLGRIGPDPATGWFFWNLQLDGREPGGRIRISRTGASADG